MSGENPLADFLPPYISEVEELVAAARTQLLAVETAARQGTASPRSVAELFRAIHTVKGLSAMVDVEPIVRVTHVMETSLRTADRTGGRLSPRGVDALVRGVDAIEKCIRALSAGKPLPELPDGLLEALEEVLAPDAPATGRGAAPALALPAPLAAKVSAADREVLSQGLAAGRRIVRVDFTPSPDRATSGLNITTVRERLSRVAEIVRVIPVSAPVSPSCPGGLLFAVLGLTREPDSVLAEAVGLPAGDIQTLAEGTLPAPQARLPEPEPSIPEELEPGMSQRHGVVRVATTRLDEAMERIGALVVNRTRLTRAVAELGGEGVAVRELTQILVENGRLLRDLRASILRIRMVRVSEILDRLPLMVRGLRRSTGHQVNLELDLGNAELDKGVGDRLFPAIVHLVRNAVDHAIEGPAERIAAGKRPDGTLRIACHELSGSLLELTVEDDGRGVDPEAVARRAGVPAPADADALLALLCRPGLSTRDEVTTTSGRGMGMDIVKRIAVDQLGGELSMSTRKGQGTSFRLRVPLTVSILDAFIFESGDQRYATPVSAIEELFEIDPAKVTYGPSPGEVRNQPAVGMVERRGVAVPLLRLDTLLSGAPGALGGKAIVVRFRGAAVALGVDRVVSQQEIVVRPLADPLVRVRGVAGATDLGDGRPTLVLDLVALSGVSQQMERVA